MNRSGDIPEGMSPYFVVEDLDTGDTITVSGMDILEKGLAVDIFENSAINLKKHIAFYRIS